MRLYLICIKASVKQLNANANVGHFDDITRTVPASISFISRQCVAQSQSQAPHQQVHHVGLVVPQCFDSVENIHRALVLKHLAHNTDGTKRSAAAASVSRGAEEESVTGKVGEHVTRKHRTVLSS